MANVEKTLVLVKPDGVKKHICGEVISRFERKDHVEPVTGAVKERSITYFIMMQNDFSLLNKIMRKIKKENNDVLSINSGVAFGENVPTIISFKTKMTLADINLLAESIRRIKGIIRIVVSEEEGSR